MEVLDRGRTYKFHQISAQSLKLVRKTQNKI